MNKRHIVRLVALSLAGAWGCSFFEDRSPENIFFDFRASGGSRITVIYSTVFLTGVEELTGATRVQVLEADTVVHTLPVDTVLNIAVDRKWFVQVMPMPEDTLQADVVIDVDDRNLVRASGAILPGDPWYFLYVFNRVATNTVEVVL